MTKHEFATILLRHDYPQCTIDYLWNARPAGIDFDPSDIEMLAVGNADMIPRLLTEAECIGEESDD